MEYTSEGFVYTVGRADGVIWSSLYYVVYNKVKSAKSTKGLGVTLWKKYT